MEVCLPFSFFYVITSLVGFEGIISPLLAKEISSFSEFLTRRIYTDKLIWKLFSFLKRVTPNFVEFNRFPPDKLYGVAVRVEF